MTARHRALLPGDVRARDGGDAARPGARRAGGRIAAAAAHNRWPDHVLRVVGAVRLFGAGVLARARWRCCCSMPISAGRRGRAGSIRGSRTSCRRAPACCSSTRARRRTARCCASALRHLALPAAVLGYFSLAYISRMTRSLMLEQLGQDYIAVARAKGLSEARVLWRHALGNVLVPLVTVATLAYAQLLEGSVLTETVFAWPGIGRYITGSLLSLDMNAVMGGTLVVGRGVHRAQPAGRGRLSPRSIRGRDERRALAADSPPRRPRAARRGRRATARALVAAPVGARRAASSWLLLVLARARRAAAGAATIPMRRTWRCGLRRRARGTGSAPTSSAATSSRASSTAARVTLARRRAGRA